LTAQAVLPAPPPVVGGPALLAVLAVVAVLVVVALRRRARAPVGRRATPIWNIPPRPAPFVEAPTLTAQMTEALRGNAARSLPAPALTTAEALALLRSAR